MIKEIWKTIKDYENYQVSNLGNCKRIEGKDSLGHLRKEKKLKVNKDIYGYCYFALCKNGKRKNFLAHRLVAKHFIKNYSEKLQVNHIDGNKQNNTLLNLEMTTDKENKKHAWENGLCKVSKKKYKKIYQYDLEGNLTKEWDSMQSIIKNTRYNKTRIYNCLKGKQKKSNGYIWRNYETSNKRISKEI